MSVGAAITGPPRVASSPRKTFRRRHLPSLDPRRPTGVAAMAASPHLDCSIATSTHLANLDRVLRPNHPPTAPPPPPLLVDEPPERRPSPSSFFLDLLNLGASSSSSSSPKQGEESMSPRSLARLHGLLSSSSRPSPRGRIAPNWRRFHGAGDWDDLLDPLDPALRRELVRYGDFVQAAYHAFHSDPSGATPDRARPVPLPDRSYCLTRHLFATTSLELPSWVDAIAPWMMTTQRTSWVGFVAVCNSEQEIRRMGRRDIVVVLRGTATCLEWAENFRTGLVPIEEDDGGGGGDSPKVECGFRSLYKTAGWEEPSLSAVVLEEVRRLTEQYAGEEMSITLVGHSLGAALAVLAADEVAANVPPTVPTAVFSFGSPRVGNQAFASRVEARGAKVLRVVNAHDMVTRVPAAFTGSHGYAHVGKELLVDSRRSPYLRPDADPACCHDLEAYLHLVDGLMAADGPFRADAKRSLARLLSQQGSNVKKLYVSKAKALSAQSAVRSFSRRCSAGDHRGTLRSSLSLEKYGSSMINSATVSRSIN